MAIPFDSDIDMQSNAIHNVAFDAASIAFASLATPAASFSMGGQKFTNHATPTAAGDVANKSYVDNKVNGTNWLGPVLCATTSNITLSGEQTIDGVTTNASRVLVKNQSTASQNGVYVTGAGSWTRASDMAAGADAANASMFIESGTTYADTQWTCTNNTGSAVVGTDNLTFVQFGSGTGYSADESTVHLAGTTFSVKSGGITSTQLAANSVTTTAITDANVTTAKIADANVTTDKLADGAVTDAKLASTFCKKYAATIGDGSTTSIVVTHNLGTRDVTVETYTNSGNYDTRNVVVQRTSTNAITLVYGTAPALNSIRVVVIG